MSYARPQSLAEAAEILSAGPRTRLAGGTDLFAMTEARRLSGPILDLTAVAEMRGISSEPEGLRIGGAVTWAEIARADLPPACDGLRAAARVVGSTQIQARGTIAGNLCNASPAADGVPPLLTLAAEAELVSARGTRRLALSDFLLGVRRTALAADEILAAVHLPTAALTGRGGFHKLGARAHLVISIGIAAARVEVEDGVLTRVSLAMGACSPVAARLAQAEAALRGVALADLPAALASLPEAAWTDALSPIDDIRADAAYRLRAAPEIARRALAAALDAQIREAAA